MPASQRDADSRKLSYLLQDAWKQSLSGILLCYVSNLKSIICGDESCYSTHRVVCGSFVLAVCWSVAAVVVRRSYLPVEL